MKFHWTLDFQFTIVVYIPWFWDQDNHVELAPYAHGIIFCSDICFSDIVKYEDWYLLFRALWRGRGFYRHWCLLMLLRSFQSIYVQQFLVCITDIIIGNTLSGILKVNVIVAVLFSIFFLQPHKLSARKMSQYYYYYCEWKTLPDGNKPCI